MKRMLLLITGFIFSFQVLSQTMEDRLTLLSKTHNFTFKELKTDTFFTEKYVLEIEQPLSHKNPNGESFTQRVFVAHKDFSNPVVFITEGYAASYAKNPQYINELSSILNANQVCVEHRYFGESVPKPMIWENLTIYNAATDHHKIVELLKNIYMGKWVNTGISKGGQTAMFHRYFYPHDVNATVGYVCPLNFSIEDKRVYRFLQQVGDSASRKKIYDYQYELLSNKATYLPSFKALAEKRKLTFNLSLIHAYELTVFEYSFAFWQWGSTPVDSIPLPPAGSKKMISHLDQVAGLDWISEQGIHRIQPFFYQALTEIGFYGYDIMPFSEVVNFTQNPVFDFTAPENTSIQYDPVPMQKVDHFIRHNAINMIFIYGGSDPWSATAVDLTYNSNVIKIVKQDGSHLTRILNLPDNQQKEIIETLTEWLK